MYCNKCGSKNEDNSKYCSNCGAVLNNSNSEDLLFKPVSDDNISLSTCPEKPFWQKRWPEYSAQQKKKFIIAFSIIISIIIISTIIIVAVSSVGSNNGEETNGSITYSNYIRIENGMTYDEVCILLGKEGALSVTSSYEEYTTSIYTWERSYPYAVITVIFDNGIVSGKG